MSMEDIIVAVEVGPQGAAGEGVAAGGTTGQVLAKASGTDYDTEWISVSGTGTVTSVSVTTANGVSGTVATATTTPAITLALGAITPTSVASSGNLTGANLSGTNTGDQSLFSTIAVSGQSNVVADSTSDTLTLVAGTNITITTDASTDAITINATSGGSGDVVGPASATDNAVARFDTTTGKLIQNSALIVDDSGNISGAGTLNTHTIPGGTGTIALTSNITGTNSGTNTGDQTITLTGDVTGSGTGSFATTIANDAVTYAKMQNVSATDKLLGRSTSGAGDVEEITCTAAGRAILDDSDASAQRTTLGVGAIGTLPTIATTITVTFDGSGSVLTTGAPSQARIPDLKAMTITSWTLVSEQSGSVVIDVWKSTYSSYPPVVGGSIAGTEKPTLSSADKNQDTSLSTWSTSIADGDCLIFNIDSVTTIEKCVLTIKGTRTA